MAEGEDRTIGTPKSVRSGRSADTDIYDLQEELQLLEGDRRIELELRLLELRAAERKMELEAETRRAELESKRIEANTQVELARIQLDTEREKNRNTEGRGNERQNSPEEQIIRFGNILKVTAPRVPDDPGSFPGYFSSIEKLFFTYKIPPQLQGTLILPLLGEKINQVINQLSNEALQSYELVKAAVLNECKLTPAEYKRRIEKAQKVERESWTQYVTRMRNLWMYYMESREIKSKEEIIELLIADKIRDSLPAETKNYVMLQEGLTWEKGEKIALWAERYEEARIPLNNGSRGKRGDGVEPGKHVAGFRRMRDADTGKVRERWPERRPTDRRESQDKCFVCNRPGHWARDCYQRPSAKPQPGSGENRMVRKENVGLVAEVGIQPLNPELETLQKVVIRCGTMSCEAIVDSGAQISVIREELVPETFRDPCGSIRLMAAFGSPTPAKLIKLPICLDSAETHIVDVLCASVKDLNAECLITRKIYEQLINRKMIDEEVMQEADLENQTGATAEFPEVQVVSTVNEDPRAGDSILESGGTNPESEGDVSNETGLSEAKIFRQEQVECESLSKFWTEARENKGRYKIRDGYLYHEDKILGEKVYQLVLPKERRNKVLELAHASIFGSHLGARKTMERIKYSFNWPNLKRETQEFCNNCQNCQLRAPARKKDRVPITPIQRPEYPFIAWSVDVIGPIVPASSKGHKFIMTAIDLHSRWPEAICLKAVTAKATCDALLEIFMRTGIPKEIRTDQGTNFVSQLTREFLARLGVAPKFSTPGHPEANGCVERFNAVLKKMLHHTIREFPRQWHTHLPYLLWAYREVPNVTTGVAPYTLVFGRTPTGPLSILQSHWSDEKQVPIGLAIPTCEYLSKLRERLEFAAEEAGLSTSLRQQAYVSHYNLRAREKEFQVGEQVLLLIPDSTNKLYARWTGPGTVIERRSPHSYVVELEEGRKRHVHANKMRAFRAVINALGVIFEDDMEFGAVPPAPTFTESSTTPLRKEIEQLSSDTLGMEQINQLRQVLWRYKNFFSGETGKVRIGVHTIKLKPGMEPKRVHVYKIPEAFKGQVEEQIRELLRKGMIERTVSGHACPTVCVAKRDGSLRLCCDFRALNEVSLGDSFPMVNIGESLRIVGKAKFISTLDLLKGYWQIPMAKESRSLTAFATHTGQFEWTVMPFGLKGAAATFQRTINLALESHNGYASAYLDDVAIFSETWELHLDHLGAVLETLEGVGFTANLQKCNFGKNQVLYLGHVVGSGKIVPDPQKLHVIQGMTRPQTKKELRSVLGLFNYYRDHIEDFAVKAYPLTELTSRRVSSKIPWTECEQRAFDELKEQLCRAPALYTPDFSKPFIIDTDASGMAVGACLSQVDRNGRENPISFASQKLSATQRKWSTIERESYAIIFALKKFEHWVFGTKVTVRSDHNPLAYLTKSYPQGPKLQRWALALQRYDLSVTHRPGKNNTNADSLTRLPGYV